MSLRRGGLHRNLPGPNAEGLAWNHIRQVYSAMGPAHLSASSPGRVAASLLALAPNLAAHPSLPRTGRRCGREGHLGPLGASLCVLTEHARCPQDRAPSTWVRGTGQRGTWGSGRWHRRGWLWHVVVRHDLSNPRLLSSSWPGFWVLESGSSGTPECGSRSWLCRFPAVRLRHVTSPLCPHFPSGAGINKEDLLYKALTGGGVSTCSALVGTAWHVSRERSPRC